MNAFTPPRAGTSGRSRTVFGAGSANATGIRWAAMCDAAEIVCVMAGMEPEKPNRAIRNFPVLIRDAEAWRRSQAENAVSDLSSVMEHGLAALLAIRGRGADARPAAMALWAEFASARAAILALLPPEDDHFPDLDRR
ncbi:hypothetical protein ACFOWT_00805 [Croceibacterium xixiisoli]|uniref:hypothetical protein n=1 Tax=Croceibacterium xixiisoli TaxID=1476466 RepID=UPI001F36A488|nr:hypothetical protein [Croceibacterium xixiisoli]